MKIEKFEERIRGGASNVLRKRNEWTEDECEIIIRYSRVAFDRELMEYLPGRSLSAIRMQRLSMKKTGLIKDDATKL